MKHKILALVLFFAFGGLQSILGMSVNKVFQTICDQVDALESSGKDVNTGLEELTKKFGIHLIERTDVVVDGVKRSQTQSLLSWAIINKKEEFIKWLIDDKECDVNVGWGYTADKAVSKKVSTHYYISPLYAALETKNFELAKKFIKHPRCAVNFGYTHTETSTDDQGVQKERKEFQSPLHLALDIDPTGVAEDLVKKEVSLLDIKDSEGRTPLEIAFERNYENILKLADQNCKGIHFDLKKRDIKGFSIFLRPDATVIKNKFINFLWSAALSGGLAYTAWKLNNSLFATPVLMAMAPSCGTTMTKGLEVVSEFRAPACSYYSSINSCVQRDDLDIDQQRVQFYTRFCSLKEYYASLYKTVLGGGLLAGGFAFHGLLTGNNMSKFAALGFGATAIQSALKGGFVNKFKSSSKN